MLPSSGLSIIQEAAFHQLMRQVAHAWKPHSGTLRAGGAPVQTAAGAWLRRGGRGPEP